MVYRLITACIVPVDWNVAKSGPADREQRASSLRRCPSWLKAGAGTESSSYAKADGVVSERVRARA